MQLLKPLRTNAKSHVLGIRFCNDWFGDGLKILPFPGYSQVTMKRNLTERGKPMKIPDFPGGFYSPRLACTTWNQEDISKKKWHPYKESIALTPPPTIAFPIHIPKEKEKSSPSSNHQLIIQVIFVKKSLEVVKGNDSSISDSRNFTGGPALPMPFFSSHCTSTPRWRLKPRMLPRKRAGKEGSDTKRHMAFWKSTTLRSF